MSNGLSILETRQKIDERLGKLFGRRLNESVARRPTSWTIGHPVLGTRGFVGSSQESFEYVKLSVVATYDWASAQVVFSYHSYDHRIQNYLETLGDGATPEEVAEFLKIILEV